MGLGTDCRRDEEACRVEQIPQEVCNREAQTEYKK